LIRNENITPDVIPETAQRLSGIQYLMGCWIPGLASGHPGMTTLLFQFNNIGFILLILF
jgi:hypothetical protein